jgi:hypothetical protein
LTELDFYSARARFFSTLFGADEGYVCLATMNAALKGFKEQFYEWPAQGTTFMKTVERVAEDSNVYFCPQLLRGPARNRDNVIRTPAVWADLDECSPSLLKVEPTVVIQTGPTRFQAYWHLDDVVDPAEVEDVAKRIAYYHKDHGADTSGWDLSQLLRVPYTVNYKYQPSHTIRILATHGHRYDLDDFKDYPQAQGSEHSRIPFPEVLPSETAEEVLHKFRLRINPNAVDLFTEAPGEGKWSQNLWALTMQCFESGMSKEQVFIVADAAACNKFRRDGRHPRYLWQDVCRAFIKHEQNISVASVPTEEEPPLISDEEKVWVEDAEPGWVERYIDWARNLGDAAHQYHQASAFIALSALLSGAVRLPTSFGTVIPNLWFMILADTTLTRKTTSMDLGMSIVEEVNDEVLLATDGSLEGMFQALSTRPGKPSVFLRDEFTGLIEAMTKRDYMAGFAEMLTKLYDGKVQKRVLKKETISVKDPIVIVYAGGIKSRMQLLLTTDQISSGFLPRFVFITAESDVNRLKPMGPPTAKDLGARAAIVNELREIFEHYDQKEDVVVAGKKLMSGRPRAFLATLTQDAWFRYNQLETTLMKIGVNSLAPDIYTPLYDRLGKSILKAALLMAAARQRENDVTVELDDIVRAIYYGEGWRAYAKEIVSEVGVSSDERKLKSVFASVERTGGCTRSTLMQHHRMTSKEADWVLTTLEQRGLILRTRSGRGEVINPMAQSKGTPSV